MEQHTPGLDQRLDALASLGDPVRRALYKYVIDRSLAVGRDEAAAASGAAHSALRQAARALGADIARQATETAPANGQPAVPAQASSGPAPHALRRILADRGYEPY